MIYGKIIACYTLERASTLTWNIGTIIYFLESGMLSTVVDCDYEFMKEVTDTFATYWFAFQKSLPFYLFVCFDNAGDYSQIESGFKMPNHQSYYVIVDTFSNTIIFGDNFVFKLKVDLHCL